MISPGSMASSFPLISLIMPSVRASNMTCSRWQAARDTVDAPEPMTSHNCSIPNSFTMAMVWGETDVKYDALLRGKARIQKQLALG